MFIDRIEISFDAAHRLLDYPGKCASPHGHTYRVEVFVARAELDRLGLAVDFGDIKQPLKEWIDKNWDHAFLLNSADNALLGLLGSVPEAKCYQFENQNPSAEVIARSLHSTACDLVGGVSRVRVWEGNQYAEFIPGAGGADERA